VTVAAFATALAALAPRLRQPAATFFAVLLTASRPPRTSRSAGAGEGAAGWRLL
jgi:hypothetical protein